MPLGIEPSDIKQIFDFIDISKKDKITRNDFLVSLKEGEGRNSPLEQWCRPSQFANVTGTF